MSGAAEESVPWRHLLVLSVLGAVATVAVAQWLFPVGSTIVDERVYIQEGRALATGDLVLSPRFHPDHDPFLTATNDRGEVVFKYTQVWPAVLGVSHRVFGTERPAVALVGFAGVLAVGALAHALFGSRRITLLAAALTIVTPLWLTLSASYLSYGLSAALALGGAAALLMAARADSPLSRAAMAGLLLGLAFFARPFDALLVVAPFAMLGAARLRSDGVLTARQIGRRVGAVAAGGLPPLVAMLAINRRITGSAFELGYSLVGPHDKLGFGPRLDIHDGVPFDFGLPEAGRTLRRGAELIVQFAPGGIVLILAALAALVWRPDRTRAALFASIGAVIAGYFFVWGPWNGYVRLRAADVMGPFYHLPVLLLAVIAGAWTVVSLRESFSTRRALLLGVSVVAVVAAVISSAVMLDGPVGRLRDIRGRLTADAMQLAGMSNTTPALVLLAGDNLGFDVAAYNNPDLDGDVVYGLDNPERLMELHRRFPDRAMSRLALRFVLDGRPGTVDYRDGLGFERDRVVERLTPETRSTLELSVSTTETAPDAKLHVRMGEHAWSWPLAESTATVQVDGGAPSVDGEEGTPVAMEPAIEQVCVGISAQLGVERDDVCFAAARTDGQWTALVPGRGLTGFPSIGGSPPALLEADVSDRLTVDLTGDG